VEEPGKARLAACRGRTRGERRSPCPVRVPAHQRRRASARRPSCQRSRAAGRHRRPHKNRTLATGRACAGGARALARAPAAACASRPGKCATRAPATRAPWCRRRRAPARAPHPRSTAGTCRQPIRRSAASAINTRRAETATPTRRRAAACERSHAGGMRRPAWCTKPPVDQKARLNTNQPSPHSDPSRQGARTTTALSKRQVESQESGTWSRVRNSTALSGRCR